MVAQPNRWQQLAKDELEQPLDADAPLLQRLEQRQRCQEGSVIYKNRGSTVEPAFGQIKSARECRHFMQRGLAKANAEWTLICLTHNLLKYYRHQMDARN